MRRISFSACSLPTVVALVRPSCSPDRDRA
jgi:hypothetical protein